MCRPSSGVMPPGAQSVAEMRTEIGLCRGQLAADRIEHLQRKAHAVLEIAAEFVASAGC